jgi:RNA-directed DNA polymerase
LPQLTSRVAGAVKRIRKRLAEETKALRGANASAVIRTLNPIVRGWAAYYRAAVSTRTFHKLDRYLWRLTYKWALYRHNRRSKHRIVDRYFGRFHPTRRDRWVFGDRDSGAFLVRFGWTKIVRHEMVKGRASPDDPTLTEYWAARGRRNVSDPPIGHTRLRLLRKQKGRCPICGYLLLHADHQPNSPEEWERWAAATRKAITKNAIAITDSRSQDEPMRLVHEYCRRRRAAQSRPALPPTHDTSGLTRKPPEAAGQSLIVYGLRGGWDGLEAHGHAQRVGFADHAAHRPLGVAFGEVVRAEVLVFDLVM